MSTIINRSAVSRVISFKATSIRVNLAKNFRFFIFSGFLISGFRNLLVAEIKTKLAVSHWHLVPSAFCVFENYWDRYPTCGIRNPASDLIVYWRLVPSSLLNCLKVHGDGSKSNFFPASSQIDFVLFKCIW